MTQTTKHAFGWHPSKPDLNNLRYAYKPRSSTLAPSVDLRPKMPPIYDQGQLGSCVANALCAIAEYNLVRQGEKDFMPSRLFNYYETRVIEHTVSSDAGCEIKDAVKSFKKNGVCHETLWPYNISKFTNKPSSPAFTQAKKFTSVSYHTVSQDPTGIQGALTDGNMVIIGFTVYESFESDAVAQTGIVPMPQQGESAIGGHAVDIVGYLNNNFIVRNSWGDQWGLNGYFMIPFAYFFDPNLSSDVWVIQTVK